MKTQGQVQSEIKETEDLIINRTSEFTGDVGDFEHFITLGIERELYAFTKNDYVGRKPNEQDFNDILFNIRILQSILELTQKKQWLENELEKQLLENELEKLKTVLN